MPRTTRATVTPPSTIGRATPWTPAGPDARHATDRSSTGRAPVRAGSDAQGQPAPVCPGPRSADLSSSDRRWPVARTLFQGGSIFDGSGSDPATGDLVVEDGRVVDIGSGLDGDEAVDVAGCTILPALFDCHVHVGITNVDLWRLAQQPLSYRVLDAARNLARTLDAGVTSVRDAGG